MQDRKEKISVLWIEDGARFDLQELAAPVLVDGRYELVIVEAASEAIDWMRQCTFDVIIADIRIPPGDDPAWIDLYKMYRANSTSARLGLHLLFTILRHKDAKVKLEAELPDWIKPEIIAVFSLEGQAELSADLKNLGISVFQQKGAGTSSTVLLDLIERVLQQGAGRTCRQQ